MAKILLTVIGYASRVSGGGLIIRRYRFNADIPNPTRQGIAALVKLHTLSDFAAILDYFAAVDFGGRVRLIQWRDKRYSPELACRLQNE